MIWIEVESKVIQVMIEVMNASEVIDALYTH